MFYILTVFKKVDYKEKKLTLGGLKGYVSGTLISSTKLPPSYGVSGGPAISPFNSVRLSLTNSTLIAHFATCYKYQIKQ